jgi:hypothetical protein
VIPKDVVNQARQRVKNEDGQLLDASSMVYITINGEPTKPIDVEINFPQSDGTGAGKLKVQSKTRINVWFLAYWNTNATS